MIKWVNRNWKSIKIAIIQWLIFLFIIACGTAYFTFRSFKRVEDKLETCHNNMEEITKQIDTGSSVIQLRFKEDK